MSEKLARAARLARRIAEWLVPVLTAIKLFIEVVSKVANCNQAHGNDRENYKHKYQSRGKFIFVPNERCERRGAPHAGVPFQTRFSLLFLPL
jgi:hypothetical protein